MSADIAGSPPTGKPGFRRFQTVSDVLQDFRRRPAKFGRMVHRIVCNALIAFILWTGIAGCSAAQPHTAQPHWVAAWGAPPDQAGEALAPQTVRQVIRVSLGGSAVRLRFSNLYGDGPVILDQVRVARSAGGSAIRPGADHPVAFGGKPAVTIPRGGSVISDPVDMTVKALENIAVSLHLPAGASAPTLHGEGGQTAYLASGNAVSAASLPDARTEFSRYFLTDVEVAASPGARLFVAVGDSITDGVGATEDRNLRWPDQLAARLQTDPALSDIAVVNAGIAGNRILNDAASPFIGQSLLNRFDRDVLDKPGVRWVLILAGGNDITASGILETPKDKVSAEQVIDGLKRLIARARARGIKVWGATLTPRGSGGSGFFTLSPENTAKREAVNAWIRTSGAFDVVVDFESATQDPADPSRLLPSYDKGDGVHLNDAGYAAMAAVIDLGLFARD
jgi:lysophospholipase L1-like esterase